MKYIICTVGGSSAPILKTVSAHPDAFFYFIGSKGTDQRAASVNTIDRKHSVEVKTECPACGKKSVRKEEKQGIIQQAHIDSSRYNVFGVDPDWPMSIWETCEKIRDKINENSTHDPSQTVYIDYTGGTKTMSATVFTFALMQHPIWQPLLQTAPDRNNLVAVATGNTAVLPDITTILYQQQVEKIDSLLKSSHYQEALAIIENYLATATLSRSMQTELGKKGNHCRMMIAWNGFDHEKALDYANACAEQDIAGYMKKLSAAKRQFNENGVWKLQNKTPYLLVEDLVRNAQTCAESGRYDDAVGRLYRGTEMLAQVHLRRCFDIRTSDVEVDKLKHIDTDWLEGYRRNGTDTTIKIGLWAGYKLLKEFNDPLGNYYHRFEKKIKDYLEMRNKSLFAHGIIPVGIESWKDNGEQWKHWLSEAVKVANAVD